MPAPRPGKMAEIVNLNRARKAKARAEKDKTAQANRIAHGTPKALKNPIKNTTIHGFGFVKAKKTS